MTKAATTKVKASKKGKKQVEQTTVVAAENQPKQTSTEAPRSSIRQLIRSMIVSGASTKDIATELEAKFPSSQAAQKSGKHISFYRSQLKKEATKKAAA